MEGREGLLLAGARLSIPRGRGRARTRLCYKCAMNLKVLRIAMLAAAVLLGGSAVPKASSDLMSLDVSRHLWMSRVDPYFSEKDAQAPLSDQDLRYQLRIDPNTGDAVAQK
jgi:hypothetical protein